MTRNWMEWAYSNKKKALDKINFEKKMNERKEPIDDMLIEDKTKLRRTADVVYAAIECAMAYENFTERTAMVIDDECLEQAVFTAP